MIDTMSDRKAMIVSAAIAGAGALRLGAALLLASTAARMAFWYAASADVHEVFLQDVLWRETRKDQARIDRWAMHVRLNAQRKREKK
jgi:hypothetical protein